MAAVYIILIDLHVSFVSLFQSNVIEAAPDMMVSGEKEWYYGNVERERLGPFSFAEVSHMIGHMTCKMP